MKRSDLNILLQLLGENDQQVGSADSHWSVGKNYFIRTVTHHYTGKLVAVTPQELVLEEACWIPDDGRFTEAVKEGKFNETEPYPDGAKVIIGRGSLVDAVEVGFKIPRSQK